MVAHSYSCSIARPWRLSRGLRSDWHAACCDSACCIMDHQGSGKCGCLWTASVKLDTLSTERGAHFCRYCCRCTSQLIWREADRGTDGICKVNSDCRPQESQRHTQQASSEHKAKKITVLECPEFRQPLTSVVRKLGVCGACLPAGTADIPLLICTVLAGGKFFRLLKTRRDGQTICFEKLLPQEPAFSFSSSATTVATLVIAFDPTP